ncbi:unnamed protein product [Agarophyton chilense]
MAPPFTWVLYSGGEVPSNMVLGGHRMNDDPLYVCRGKVNDVDVGGKFYAVNKRAYFPYDGKEHVLETCEILCSDSPQSLKWVPASNGEADDAAVFIGYDTKGVLYVARGEEASELLPGKLYLADKTCYVSTQHKEFSCTNYEVLSFGA